MFQTLPIDDFMVIDVTLDNPTIWYEISESHAIGAGDVVLIRDGLGEALWSLLQEQRTPSRCNHAGEGRSDKHG